jgi:hypothetical protein
MKLQVPFIQLPLRFDAARLAAEIDALGEGVWRPHPQGFPGNSMLPLVAAEGDPCNEAFSGPMRPTPELARCPYLWQVFSSIGATIGRSRLMRLSGHAEVTRHVDQGYYWVERVRVHVPIVTQPTVRFECGDAAINMAEGECWIFDTWRPHRVINDAHRSRIHLVIDTVGSGDFWQLVRSGRPHTASVDTWQARFIPAQEGAQPGFPLETRNIPSVMSPWEMQSHFGVIFAEAIPHPALGNVQQLTANLLATWRGLWARYGEAAEGRPYYQAALDQFIADARGASQALFLRNEIRWFSAMMTMIGKVAVGAPASTPTPEYSP